MNILSPPFSSARSFFCFAFLWQKKNKKKLEAGFCSYTFYDGFSAWLPFFQAVRLLEKHKKRKKKEAKGFLLRIG